MSVRPSEGQSGQTTGPPMKAEDAVRLLSRAREHHDMDAFEEFCVAYEPWLVRVASRVAPQDAKDCVQELYVKLLTKPIRLEGGIHGWLKTVATHTAYDVHRWNRRTIPGENWMAMAGAVDHDERLRAAIDDCLSRQKDKQRHALIAHHVAGESWEEIGADLGWTPGTAAARGSKAKGQFEDCLRSHGVRTNASGK